MIRDTDAGRRQDAVARESRPAEPVELVARRPTESRRVLGLVLALLSGALLTMLLLASTFRLIPNDLMRIETLLGALAANDDEIRAVVLGPSVAMVGVDGNQLGVPAYSLTTTGQSLAESRLLIQELPPTITTIFLVVSPIQLERQLAVLPRDVFNAYWMYGLRLQDETRAELEAAAPQLAPELFSMTPIAHIFHSRWNVIQGVDYSVRALLRRDLAMDRVMHDLRYPAVFTRQISPRKMKAAVEEHIADYGDTEFELLEGQELLLRSIARAARDRSARLVLAVAPVHPSVGEYLGDGYHDTVAAQLRQIMESEGQEFIDGMDLLDDERFFIDHAHLAEEGAALFTALLVDRSEAH